MLIGTSKHKITFARERVLKMKTFKLAKYSHRFVVLETKYYTDILNSGSSSEVLISCKRIMQKELLQSPAGQGNVEG